MDIRDKLIKIIKNENKKCPFTDDEIAKQLAVTREAVTLLRKELNTPDSRDRRKTYLYKDIESILEKNKDINVSLLTKEIVGQGYKVSRNVVSKIKAEIEQNRSDNTASKKEEVKDSFEALVGFDESLKPCVMQAKASILYPPFGIPTLIVGESGVGKTNFVECMYKFAKDRGVIDKNAPFKVLNCADYSENPQLLLSILFGYKKGAFTGADRDTCGIVQEANNGVLFLDEIHRLPPEGQEILFSILDRGSYRRLGETSSDNKANVIFVGATTENIESSLLLSFRRRIPMLITIPPLSQRDITEKIELIHYFFQQECNRINSKIFVESKAIKMLAMKKYQGNIGQLRSEIQVICANAFMKNIGSRALTINIGLEEFLQLDTLQKDIITDKKRLMELNSSAKDTIFVPFLQTKVGKQSNIIKDNYCLPINIYTQIEKKYKELEELRMGSEEIKETLSSFIINEFRKINVITKESSKLILLDKLSNILNQEVINAVRELRDELEIRFEGRKLNENILSYLAIHIEETIRRIKVNQNIVNYNIDKIVKDLKSEFDIALEFCKRLEQKFKINIPVDEAGFVAMYINSALKYEVSRKHVGIIVMSHGKIATEIINVVKAILNEDFPVAVDMPLDENPMKTYERVMELVKLVDEGKGILFLVDMGSLINIGDMVSEKFGIPTRTIDRVDLLSVLEAVRKATIEDSTLDNIYFSLIKAKFEYPSFVMKNTAKPMALLSVCLTGKGLALRIREYLEQKYPGVNIFQLGITDKSFEDKAKSLCEQYNIVAAIGTVNPEIEGINFIPFQPDILASQSKTLELLLNAKNNLSIENLLEDDLLIINPSVSNKNELIEIMSSILINKGYVKKEYINSVISREEMVPTFFKWRVAIPHGQPDKVIKSSIVFAKLKEPMEWGAGRVDIVCLAALKYSDKKIISSILKLFSNNSIMSELRRCNSSNAFKTCLLNSIQEG